MTANDTASFSRPFPALTPAQRYHFDVFGYVVVENTLSAEETAAVLDAEIREAFREIERGEYTDYSREELSRVFERARRQGLELLAKTHPHKVSDAAYPSA